jgi:predicted anti-sigma-YlaC factor YlaD
MMTCADALDSIEAVASGDMTPDEPLRAHLASCGSCADALESARQLERLLKVRAVPRPQPHFSTGVMTRIRRARWRSEQLLDWSFNAALGLAVVAVIAVGWFLLARSGLLAVRADVFALTQSGLSALVRRVAPSVPLYATASGLVLSALAVWWWAERDAAF